MSLLVPLCKDSLSTSIIFFIDTFLNSTPKMFFRSIFNLENILILNKTNFSVYLNKCSSNHRN